MIFCGPGMHTTEIGLGAGGSCPSEIPSVDRINVVNTALLSCAGFFGGSTNNQLGPKYTLMLRVSRYPVYIGALWYYLTILN
jgi:hypothetical protein